MSERFRRELDHLAGDLANDVPGAEGRDAFLRRAAAALECRITFIAADGKVLDDTDLLPADVPAMENHASREEVRAAVATGSGVSRRLSPTEQKPHALRGPPPAGGQRAAAGRFGGPARPGRARLSLDDARRRSSASACCSS